MSCAPPENFRDVSAAFFAIASEVVLSSAACLRFAYAAALSAAGSFCDASSASLPTSATALWPIVAPVATMRIIVPAALDATPSLTTSALASVTSLEAAGSTPSPRRTRSTWISPQVSSSSVRDLLAASARLAAIVWAAAAAL